MKVSISEDCDTTGMLRNDLQPKTGRQQLDCTAAIGRGSASDARTLTRGDIFLCLHTLATGSDEDFIKLHELDILNRDPDAAVWFHEMAQAS